MEKTRKLRLNVAGIMEFARANPRMVRVAAISAAVIVLFVSLCISIAMRSHIQSEYASARSIIEESACSDLYMLCKTFDQVGVPEQDVQNTVLPSMQNYYYSARALNSALAKAFGDKYMILRPDTVTEIDEAFETYFDAFRTGSSTAKAEETMRGCIETIREIIESRNK